MNGHVDYLLHGKAEQDSDEAEIGKKPEAKERKPKV